MRNVTEKFSSVIGKLFQLFDLLKGFYTIHLRHHYIENDKVMLYFPAIAMASLPLFAVLIS
jgi:hypothetical protein